MRVDHLRRYRQKIVAWVFLVLVVVDVGVESRLIAFHSHRPAQAIIILQAPFARGAILSSLNGDDAVSNGKRAGTVSIESKTDAQLVHTFLSHVQKAVQADTLLSFSLRGPSKNALNDSDRGCLRMVEGRSIGLAKKKRVVQVTFKYHGTTDICKIWEATDCVVSNLASILTSSDDTMTVVPASEWGVTRVSPNMGSPRGMRSAVLQTTDGTEYKLTGGDGQKTKLTQRRSAPDGVALILQEHDHVKQGPVDVTAPVWQALGVTTTVNGTVKATMSSKLRQCQKFVEIVHRLIASGSSSSIPKHISVVDMGCGRGYLTFALHSFLYQTYTRHGTAVASRGIDERPKLIREISDIARALGSEFDALLFETGTIQGFLAESSTAPTRRRTSGEPLLDVLIALHACDTATDDALWSGVAREANVIVVAPCCHRQVRPQLNQYAAAVKDSHPYSDILRHNTYRERIAETVTDSMRALLLELAGYTVQVFEFIGGEHTSKNVMITAVNMRPTKCSNTAREERRRTDLLVRIRQLARLHGIREQKLAAWMGIALVPDDGDAPPAAAADRVRGRPLSANTMPPLKVDA